MNNQFLFGEADPLSNLSLDRRSFMKTVGAGALLSSTGLTSSIFADDKVQKSRNETLVLELYNSFA